MSIDLGFGVFSYFQFLTRLIKTPSSPTCVRVVGMAKEKKIDSGLADPSLLDKIDKLFACGAGEYVPLPQLIVVGDQSSGKSSVLEGLTSLPFPRDSGLCTRFATHITFRRGPEASISVSVTPASSANAEHAKKLKAWGKPDLKALDVTTFSDIMTEVREPTSQQQCTDLGRSIALWASERRTGRALAAPFLKMF